MAKIIIDRKKYGEEFRSICELCFRGFGPIDQPRVSIENYSGNVNPNTCIRVGDNEFYLGDTAQQESDETAARSFGKNGASWFEALRGGKGADDGMADWVALIERVATSYHKKYSLVEFKQDLNSNRASEAAVAQGLQFLRALIQEMYPKIYEKLLFPEKSNEQDTEDVYGVSLRLGLNGGVGEEIPVLAKLYFRQGGGVLMPLKAEEGKMIDNSINNVLDGDVGSNSHGSRGDGSAIIDKVLNAFQNTIDDLADKLCYSQSRIPGRGNDQEIINSLIEQTALDTLDCKSIKILGISHVSWKNSAVTVSYNDRPILKAVIRMSGDISLYCLNCYDQTSGASVLLENNCYTIKDSRTRKIVASGRINYDPNKGLDIPSQDADKIREMFNSHLTEPQDNNAGSSCNRLVCRSNQRNLGTLDTPMLRCYDCPFPEVVFYDGAGNKFDTSILSFARDKLTLITASDVKTCSVCGRTFSKEEGMEDGMCSFCEKALKSADEEAAKKTYKKYSYLFSTLKRFFYMGRKKRCYESEDILLFVIGKKKLIFNKIDWLDNGYINPPKEV